MRHRCLAKYILIIALLFLWSGRLFPTTWRPVSSSDPKLGMSFTAQGDLGVPAGSTHPYLWTMCVVLENLGPPAPLGFRSASGSITISSMVIPTGGRIALRLGHEPVEFLFYETGHTPPRLIARLPVRQLWNWYPFILLR